MSATVALLALGAGLALARPPGGVDAPPGGVRPFSSRARRPASRRTLQLLATCGTGSCCVLLLGVNVGLFVAACAVPAAWVAAGRLHDRPQRVAPTADLALSLDLVAAALRAGQPLASALLLAAPAAGQGTDTVLARVGGLLRLGAGSDEAWRAVGSDPVLGSVAAVARRSADSGIRLAGAFDELAVELRATLRATAQARAHRAGVLAVAPLGLCFLPAFVCLGIVPVVVGIADSAFGALR